MKWTHASMISTAVTLLLVGAACRQPQAVATRPVVPPAVSNQPIPPAVDEPAATTEPAEPKVVEPAAQPEALPHRITVLPVPFMVQAPHANWALPYQEACEEASMLMVVDYFAKRSDLRIPADEADRRLLEFIDWEAEHGYAIDVTAAEVAAILGERFQVAARVVPYDAEIVRQELRAKRPVIIPAAGRLLGNPYFRRPGPLYHMLVIKGYEGDEFIVNDPGTKRGESYRYHESAFTRAAHDWNGGDVENGQQVMIVVSS